MVPSAPGLGEERAQLADDLGHGRIVLDQQLDCGAAELAVRDGEVEGVADIGAEIAARSGQGGDEADLERCCLGARDGGGGEHGGEGGTAGDGGHGIPCRSIWHSYSGAERWGKEACPLFANGQKSASM